MLALSVGGFFVDVGRSLREALYMLWDTLWALVLGFTLSGAVQAFVSRKALQRQLGNHGPASTARASLYGMASSSCSYAASAMARSLFAGGADFLAAMVFMVASTNLVVELGVVLLVLIGWQFLAAEFVGGIVMIVLLVTVGGLWLRGRAVTEARSRVQASAGADPAAGPERGSWHRRARSRAGWADAAGFTVSDLTMLRKELVVGFGVAGFLTVLVPAHLWADLFIRGHGPWTTIENAIVGPLVAVLSFVCSIGNVPLAAALWQGGIQFGGVVAFVFADLITLPLLLVYRRQYGLRLTLRMFAVFWAVMSSAGLLTEVAFRALHWIPSHRHGRVVGDTFRWNLTTAGDVVALAGLGILYWLYRNRERLGGGAGYGKDPVCGMQVDAALAPASLRHDGRTVVFCSEHCAHRFSSDPDRYREPAVGPEPSPPGDFDPATLDPVCGMSVDPSDPGATLDHGGRRVSFCCPGCAEAFGVDPDRYLPEVSTDPVCGMGVVPSTAAAHRRSPQGAVWFCSTSCAAHWDSGQGQPVQLGSRR